MLLTMHTQTAVLVMIFTIFLNQHDQILLVVSAEYYFTGFRLCTTGESLVG
jgi:hypothetical protein